MEHLKRTVADLFVAVIMVAGQAFFPAKEFGAAWEVAA